MHPAPTMESSPCHQPPQLGLLPAAVSAELARLGQDADRCARGQLAELGDAAAGRVLRKVAEAGARVRNLSAFIKYLAKQEAMERTAAGIPTAESAACSLAPFRAAPRAANCWLTHMDQLLAPRVSQSEKDLIKINMLELVDIYYWALDAPKNKNKIKIPQHLIVKKYLHFLEREPSYQSTSLLGEIYDKAKSQQSETIPAIKISPLKCFTGEPVPEDYKRWWTGLYHKYLKEGSALCKLEDKEERSVRFRELYQDYKLILYEAEEFETSPRSRSDLFNEARAIYQVVYEHAAPRNEVSKCGLAWKVAGRALCELYLLKHGGERVTCLRSVLENAFKKNRAEQPHRAAEV